MPGHGFELGFGAKSPRNAGFNPLSLSPSAWWDFSDLSTLYQSGSRASPGAAVAADGNPIGLVLDKSGNNKDFTASDPWKPLYKTSGGLHWALLDGTDDGLFYGSNPALPADADVFIAYYNSGAKTDYIILDNAASNALPIIQAGSGLTTSSGSGTPADFVDGAAVSPDTRGQMSTVIGSAGPHVIEVRNANLSTWTTNLRLGLFASFIPGGRLYGLLIFPALSAENRAKVRTWLGAKAGLTL